MADSLNDKLILSHTELSEDQGLKLNDKVVLNVARSYLNPQSPRIKFIDNETPRESKQTVNIKILDVLTKEKGCKCLQINNFDNIPGGLLA